MISIDGLVVRERWCGPERDWLAGIEAARGQWHAVACGGELCVLFEDTHIALGYWSL